MSVLDSVKSTLMMPINREGYPFIAIAAVGTLVIAFWGGWLFWPMLALTVWCVLFFRDPKRVTPARDGLVIAPADGRISLITNAAPPPELGMGPTPLPRVSIFMSVFNCHVNRAPISAKIAKIAYKPGLFLNADLDKASDDNERNSFILKSPWGTFAMVQIAGLVARRIVCWVEEGHQVGPGDRMGMIRFGSRVDVYFPEGSKVLVAEGQTAIAGETVLADLASKEGTRVMRVG
ncbi:MAG: phosphatidylserine decarboxylase [Alphaproteobacteria bacterium]